MRGDSSDLFDMANILEIQLARKYKEIEEVSRHNSNAR
jgi:hypothetical protein